MSVYAFIHIPKTAGSSMRNVLRGTFGPRHFDIKVPKHRRKNEAWVSEETFRKGLRFYPKAAGICGHRVVPFMGLERVVPDLKYFTFLRDPLERCVSHFHHSQRGRTSMSTPLDLIHFCQQPEMRNLQCQFLCPKGTAAGAIVALEQQVGFVGLCDRFDESLKMLRAWLETPAMPTASCKHNTCPSRPAWDILSNPTLRANLEACNEEDMMLYRYVVENRYPRQTALYAKEIQDTETTPSQLQKEGLWAASKRNLVLKPALHFGLI